MADTIRTSHKRGTGAAGIDPALRPAGSRGRIAWLEAAKGVGIVLLVTLHVCAESRGEMSPAIVWFLRLFRMPMFFIVSGMLFSPRPGRTLLEGKLRSLIVPYLAFLVLISLLISLRAWVLDRPSPLLADDALRDLLLGGEYLKGDFGVFWFMTCLLFTQLLFNAVIRRWENPGNVKAIGAIGTVYLAGYLLWCVAPALRTPWAIGVVPFGLPFMWFGYLVKVRPPGAKAAWSACAATIALAACLGAGVHYGMDLKYAEPGPIFIGIALAIAISWLFFQIMRAVSAVPWLAAPCETVGAASMTIMFLHQFVHLSLRMIGIKSEVVLIVAGTMMPMVFWIIARRTPLLGALFLGTVPSLPLISRRLIAA